MTLPTCAGVAKYRLMEYFFKDMNYLFSPSALFLMFELLERYNLSDNGGEDEDSDEVTEDGEDKPVVNSQQVFNSP